VYSGYGPVRHDLAVGELAQRGKHADGAEACRICEWVVIGYAVAAAA
jgi:hypothetical protein